MADTQNGIASVDRARIPIAERDGREKRAAARLAAVAGASVAIIYGHRRVLTRPVMTDVERARIAVVATPNAVDDPARARARARAARAARARALIP